MQSVIERTSVAPHCLIGKYGQIWIVAVHPGTKLPHSVLRVSRLQMCNRDTCGLLLNRLKSPFIACQPVGLRSGYQFGSLFVGDVDREGHFA